MKDQSFWIQKQKNNREGPFEWGQRLGCFKHSGLFIPLSRHILFDGKSKERTIDNSEKLQISWQIKSSHYNNNTDKYLLKVSWQRLQNKTVELDSIVLLTRGRSGRWQLKAESYEGRSDWVISRIQKQASRIFRSAKEDKTGIEKKCQWDQKLYMKWINVEWTMKIKSRNHKFGSIRQASIWNAILYCSLFL